MLFKFVSLSMNKQTNSRHVYWQGFILSTTRDDLRLARKVGGKLVYIYLVLQYNEGKCRYANTKPLNSGGKRLKSVLILYLKVLSRN